MSYISMLNENLREAEEKLSKLEAAKPKLEDIQSEFKAKAHLCTDPALSGKTYKGEHADDFEEIRTDLKERYLHISDTQLEGTLQQIEKEITNAKNQIAMLKQQITAEEANIKAQEARKAKAQ
ncbi:DUF5082 domain-containing protein [Metabacillus sp. GX 13764]|uniref:YwqH-like family protein n=1 Tax=Metabacillus kandeliae TaxID=2900151 RepID=UPI001E5CB545|nr:DUF5082 family protein [Metabacillus kandeliae]MCD7034176.1 DUF5082 domain-containing protein [Metabacillus kandeliae]